MKVEFCPWPIQVEVALLSRKQPPVKEIPPANVAVALPTVSWFATFKLVVVALVPVAEVKVRVEIVPLVEARSVAVAAVEFSVWMVEEPSVMRLVNDAKRPDSCVVTFKLVVVPLVPIPFVKFKVLTLARVEKKSVEVAAVEVESPIVRNCAVDEAEKIPEVAVKEPTF